MRRLERYTFAFLEGDHSTYQLGADDDLIATVKAAPFVAVDIETGKAGTDRQWTIKACSVGTPDKSWVLDPIVDQRAIREVHKVANGLVYHNAFYDVPILYKAGLIGLDALDRVHCSQTLSRLSNPSDQGGNDLGSAADRVLGQGYKQAKTGVDTYLKRVTGARSKGDVFDLLGLESDAYIAYAGFDVIITARLFEALPEALRQHHADHPFSVPQYATAADVQEREMLVMQTLLYRSCIGIPIADDAAVDGIRGAFLAKVAEEDATLVLAGVPYSPSDTKMRQSLMHLLDVNGILPPRYPRSADGTPSGDKRYLSKINDPLVECWLRRIEASAYANKFIDQYFLTHSGRVHPNVKIAAAKTGRMSYSNPPLQQIPGDVRPMLRFDEPSTSFDWSSIEPVVLFNATGEHDLVESFENGGDLYIPIAEMAGITRKEAKVVLLAQMYGQGVDLLARNLNATPEEAVIVRDKVKAAMPKAIKVINSIRGIGDAHGRMLTMYGRNIPIDPDPRTGNHRYLGYQGVNYFIQGTALDLLSDAIVSIAKEGIGDAIVLAIHDELVVETEVAEDVRRIMETPPEWFCEAVGRTPKLRVGRTDMGTVWSNKS